MNQKTDDCSGFVKDLVLNSNSKTALYIGIGRHPEHQFINELIEMGFKSTILEIFKPYIQPAIDYLNKRYPQISFEFLLGDVRNYDFGNRNFDMVLWSHGPEHVNKNEIKSILYRLCKIANNLVFSNCPYGTYPQGEVDGNKDEAHLCSLYPEDFTSIGFQSIAFGKKDSCGGSVISYVFGDDLQKIKAQGLDTSKNN